MNGPNKLYSYISQSYKDLSGTNTLAYLGLFISYVKLKCCEYNTRDNIHNTSFSSLLKNEANKLECFKLANFLT